MKILHASDLHFQADCPISRWPRLGWRRVAAQTEFRLLKRRLLFLSVEQTVRRILVDADRAGVDHLIVSGDLTALALPEEFAAAHAALAAWSDRITLVPGNHDRYTPAAMKDRLFEEVFADMLRSDLPEHRREGAFPVVKLPRDGLAVVGLSSARVPLTPGIAAGWVGRAQRDALAAILADPRVTGRAVIVTVHHAPRRPSGRRDWPTHGLWDGEEILDLASRAGVAAVCHGHIHERFRLTGPRGLPIFGAGSSTQRGVEGYWLFDVGPDGLHSAGAVDLSSGS